MPSLVGSEMCIRDSRTDHRIDHRKDNRTDHRAYHRPDRRRDHRPNHRANHRTDHRTDRTTDHRTDHRFPGDGLDLSGQMTPDLYDLKFVSIFAWWEPYILHDVSWVGSVLYRSCAECHTDKL